MSFAVVSDVRSCVAQLRRCVRDYDEMRVHSLITLSVCQLPRCQQSVKHSWVLAHQACWKCCPRAMAGCGMTNCSGVRGAFDYRRIL